MLWQDWFVKKLHNSQIKALTSSLKVNATESNKAIQIYIYIELIQSHYQQHVVPLICVIKTAKLVENRRK
jgi:hypothetical protein